MTKPERAPREAVPVWIMYPPDEAADCLVHGYWTREAGIDSLPYVLVPREQWDTDPIRTLWPEVVEALDALVREFKVPEGREPHLYFRTWRAASEVLTRARAITPEGGEQP